MCNRDGTLHGHVPSSLLFSPLSSLPIKHRRSPRHPPRQYGERIYKAGAAANSGKNENAKDKAKDKKDDSKAR